MKRYFSEHRFNFILLAAVLLAACAGIIDPASASMAGLMLATTAKLATGTVLRISAGSPTSYLVIGNAKSFTAMDGTNQEVDATNFASTAKEFLMDITDNGTVQFEVDTDFGNVGQAAAVAAKEAVPPTLCSFQVALPSSMTTPTLTFDGYVKKFNVSGQVGQIVKSMIEIRVTGPVVRA